MCNHAVRWKYDESGDNDGCALCDNSRLKINNAELEYELSMWKKVVGHMKVSDLIAIAEKSGMNVSIRIVKSALGVTEARPE